MKIKINDKEVEVLEGETLIEVARRMGHVVPSLCYSKDAKHKSSCMVCAVKNCANGQIIPSCTTMPTEGMEIDVESEEVNEIRRMSLELLLSDHRADCEAPCTTVCPQGLDIERMLAFYDAGKYQEAYSLIAGVFALPEIGCTNCKAPCEKACRRGTVDKAVEIRAIIKEIAAKNLTILPGYDAASQKMDKVSFRSRLGRFTPAEKELLKVNTNNPSRCLHCACNERHECKLRKDATLLGISRPSFETSSKLPFVKIHINGDIWFEPAKCVRCGLCVYNSKDGFTFRNRGFGMQVIIPDESKSHITEEIAHLCPTGALYVKTLK